MINEKIRDYLFSIHCYLKSGDMLQDTVFDSPFSPDILPCTDIYVLSPEGKELYVDMLDLGDRAYCAKFIYDHKLSNLDTTLNGRCVCIGFSEDEQAWYGWSHRGYGKFKVGYEILPDTLMASQNDNFPGLSTGFVCKTLEDCRRCACKMADELD